MQRRQFLALAPALGLVPRPAWPETPAPSGREPIAEPHFPSRLYQFVWRNWEVANTDRMAQVVGTMPEIVIALGRSMGLPAKPTLTEDQLARFYITVIRRNWHLLPENQIVELLGWTEQRYRFTLKEDDFLDIKLGVAKPRCTRLIYRPPSERERAAAREMRENVGELFGSELDIPGEARFAFVGQLSDSRYPSGRDPEAKAESGEIDLSHGWALDADGQPDAGERLRRYLREAMGVSLLDHAGTGVIRLSTDGERSLGREGFRIEVSSAEVRITAAEPTGVLRAIYFLQDSMERREAPVLKIGTEERRTVWDPRYLYSYFALYGDPLTEPERDPFPDAYLEKLGRCGVNGVWIQAVLNTLAPSPIFPEFGAGWETRLRNLQALTERAARHGLRVYLYLNEPRAMDAEFFRRHPDVRGSSFMNTWAMCTSVPKVREWISASLAHVFHRVPGLGGVFCITMSENHTNCFSHGGAWGDGAPNAGDCPRCKQRQSWDTIAEVITAFRDGVRRESQTADVIAWDWGWGDALSAHLIPLMPKDCSLLSISEWDAPVHRGGVDTKVGEYSLSVVGPGPRALRNWRRARAAGVRPLAKVQFNNTWETAAVPYVPVLHLVVEHCENLARAGVAGVMPSWTCGGYASPNLAAAMAYASQPHPDGDTILLQTAEQRYGRAAAPQVVEAWRQFSEAYREYPYGIAVYVIPTQHGPANLLRLRPTGYKPAMILFPYDGYKEWSGQYPPQVVQRQFARMAALWQQGLDTLVGAMVHVFARKQAAALLDLAIARTCHCHFQSTANQIEFYLLRDSGAGTAARERMRAIVRAEMDLARRQFAVARDYSVIGYEASNHYFYTPLDLVEKTLNCREVLRQLGE